MALATTTAASSFSSSLYLVTNVLHQCKRGVLYPESNSEWPRETLVRVLQLSGIVGQLSMAAFSYDRLVQVFLDHLAAQSPVVYTLCTDQHLLLNSATVVVRDHRIHWGPYAQLVELPASASCDDVWRAFCHHLPKATPQDYRPPKPTDQQEHLLRLEQTVLQLQKQLQAHPNTQAQAERDESDRMIKALTAQLERDRQATADLHLKNFDLAREIQIQQAQAVQLRDQLQQVRSRLGNPALSPAATDEALRQLVGLKQRLHECEARGAVRLQ